MTDSQRLEGGERTQRNNFANLNAAEILRGTDWKTITAKAPGSELPPFWLDRIQGNPGAHDPKDFGPKGAKEFGPKASMEAIRVPSLSLDNAAELCGLKAGEEGQKPKY